MHGLAAHGMALDVLDEHRAARRRRRSATCEDGARTRQGVAQDAAVDGEQLGAAVAAVDDAGHLAGAAQAAGGAGSLRGAGGQVERGGGVGGGGHERQRMVAEPCITARLGWVIFVYVARRGADGHLRRAPRHRTRARRGPLHDVPAVRHDVVLEAPRGRRGRRRGRQRPAPLARRSRGPPAGSRCRTPTRRARACATTPGCATPTRAPLRRPVAPGTPRAARPPAAPLSQQPPSGAIGSEIASSSTPPPVSGPSRRTRTHCTTGSVVPGAPGDARRAACGA